MKFGTLMKYDFIFIIKKWLIRFLVFDGIFLGITCIAFLLMKTGTFGGADFQDLLKDLFDDDSFLNGTQMILYVFAFIVPVSISYENFQVTTANCISRKNLICSTLTSIVCIATFFTVCTLATTYLLKEIMWFMFKRNYSVALVFDIAYKVESFIDLLMLFGMLILFFIAIGLVAVMLNAILMNITNATGIIIIIMGFIILINVGINAFADTLEGEFDPDVLVPFSAVWIVFCLVIYIFAFRRVKFDKAAEQKAYNN